MTITPSLTIGAWNSAGVDGAGVLWRTSDMTGFEDTAPVRISFPDNAGADGSVDQQGFKAARVVTWSGKVRAPNRVTRQQAKIQLRAAANDLVNGVDIIAHLDDGDYLLHGKASADWKFAPWGPNGFQYQAVMTCADPLVYSTTLKTASASLIDQSVGTGAKKYPYSYPYDFGGPGFAAGQMIVNNAGTETTWPMIRIDGPGTNLRLDDQVSGFHLTILSLSAGQFVLLDPRPNVHSVLLMGYQSRRDLLSTDSDWFGIEPGTSSVNFGASAFSSATVSMTWRDAF